MILKIILSWIVKIVTGSILALIALIIINDTPSLPVEKVIFTLMLCGGVVFTPALVVVLVLANMNKYTSERTILKKIREGYLITFLVTLGFGIIFITFLFKGNNLVLPLLNFSVSMSCFGLGALLAWYLLFRSLWKLAPQETAAENPGIIDDLDYEL